MNQPGSTRAARIGVFWVALGFIPGFLAYVDIMAFCFNSSNHVLILAALCTILMACIMDMMDFLLGGEIGLKPRPQTLFSFLAIIPMMATSAGNSRMSLPVMNKVADWRNFISAYTVTSI